METPSDLSLCVAALEAEVVPSETSVMDLLPGSLPSLMQGPFFLSTTVHGYARALAVVDGTLPLDPAGTVEETAAGFLRDWGCLTGLGTSTEWSLLLNFVKTGTDGDTVLHYRQAIGDYPLFGSGLTLWIGQEGQLLGMMNRTIPTEVLDTSGLSAQQVTQQFEDSGQQGLSHTPGLFHPIFVEPVCNDQCLYSAAIPAYRKMTTVGNDAAWFFVSPVDGAILGHLIVGRYDEPPPTKYGCFSLTSSFIDYYPLVCAIGDEDCSECDGCETYTCGNICSLCQLATSISDYLFSEFSRTSWDDNKAPMGLVPECLCNPASTNPGGNHELQFISDWYAVGDHCVERHPGVFVPSSVPANCTKESWVCGVALAKDRTCLDVAMHEVGHLINFAERRLGLDGESLHVGAIEEGFCDILGEGAESSLSGSETADWNHGTGGTCLPTRNLAEPSQSRKYGNVGFCGAPSPVDFPDHASNYLEIQYPGETGHGHHNATILGKMAHLLSRPDDSHLPDFPGTPVNHWGINVFGVGERYLRQIIYSAFTHPLLPPDATYSDLWFPFLLASLSNYGWFPMVKTFLALASVGFWSPARELSWGSGFAIAAEYYPTDSGHSYWLFMNIGGQLVAFGRTCNVSRYCPYTVQILGGTTRGVTSTIYEGEIHVFALAPGGNCTGVKHWKIGRNGVAVSIGHVVVQGKTLADSDRTPAAIVRNGILHFFYRNCRNRMVMYAKYKKGDNTWFSYSTPFSTSGAANAVVTDVFTYVFYQRTVDDMMTYYRWSNADDGDWNNHESDFPATPYRRAEGTEPPGLEMYRGRLHLSYPSYRAGGVPTVYAGCSVPCVHSSDWTEVTQVDGRDTGTVWVYLSGGSQNNAGLYQFRGSPGNNVKWRWKLSK